MAANISSEEKSNTLEFASPKLKFTKRAGTVDRGRVYELHVMAYLLLKLITNPNVTDFLLSTNDSDYGNFDDIVVSVKTPTNETTYALQVKHSEKSKPITENSLTERRGMFNLPKYFESFQAISKHQNCSLIYFTNSKLMFHGGELSLDNEPFKFRVEQIRSEPFLNTNKHGDMCYKFKIKQSSASDWKLLEDYQHFFDHFYMYTDQEYVGGLVDKNLKDFMSLFHSNSTSIFHQYLDLLSRWTMFEGVNIKLDKKWFETSIGLLFLRPAMKPLTFGNVNPKMRILREAIAEFTLTVVEERVDHSIRGLWGDLKRETEDLVILNTLARKYLLASTNFSKLDDIDDLLFTQLAWIMGQCPLIVNGDVSVFKAVELCQKQTFILLGNATKWGFPGHKIFQRLSDLNQSPIYDQILKRFTFSIQGNQETDLEYVTKLEKEFASSVTPSDLVDLLEDNYLVDGKKEDLPTPYITRSLSRIVISPRYLEDIDSKTTLVLLSDSTGSNLRTIPDCSGDVSKDVFASKTFRDFCDSAPKVHHFKVMVDGNLEWLQSKGGVDDLYQYQVDGHFVEETEIYSACENKVNIVCAAPGMGKTVLMKSLKNSTRCLTLLLLPEEILKLCNHLSGNQSVSVDEIIERMFSLFFDSHRPLERKILKVLLQRGKVCYIWDGLDELPPKNRCVVFDLVDKLSLRCLTQWITARSSLKQELEKQFSCFSRNLRPLTNQEQHSYVKTRLQNHCEEGVVESIVQKQSSLQLPIPDNSLGSPLLLCILTEILQRNDLPSKLSIADLYSQFVELKYQTYLKQKMVMNEDNPLLQRIFEDYKRNIIDKYEKIAVRSLFSDNILHEMNFVDDGLDEDYFGFLLNGNFIHSSFAEYFAANFLQKHCTASRLLKVLFQEKYSNVRLFFDFALAGNSPPHLAVLRKDFDFLKIYDEVGKSKDLGGRSPLHVACSWGTRYPVLKVQQDGSAYVIDDDSPFHMEDRKYLEILDFLLDKCDVTEIDNLFKMNASSYADVANSVAAKIKIVLKENKTFSEIDESSINLLYYSTRFGINEALRLFKHIPFVSTAPHQNTLLHLAVHDDKVVEILLKGYINSVNCRNKNGETPLYLACQVGNSSTVKLLTRFGADLGIPNIHGLLPIHVACQNGHLECAKLLIVSGGNVNALTNDGNTALHLASQNEDLKCTELLIESGADINVINNCGATPLHISCQKGNVKITEILIYSGADINILTSTGLTPLHLACQNRHSKCVEFLIKCGANIDSFSPDGTTALHLACQGGDVKSVMLLIMSGARVDVPSADGTTPLHLACQNGWIDVVKMLLQKGASVNVCSKSGGTPLRLASEKGWLDIVRLLNESGTVS